VIVLLSQIISLLQFKSKRIHTFIEGEPGLLIKEGQIAEDSLRKERMTRDELFSMLREERIPNTGEIRYAFLDLSGEIGLILYDEAAQKEGESTLNDSSSGGPQVLG